MSTVDDTASTVQGLVAGGRRASSAVKRAAAYLRRAQNPDGGLPLSLGDASNAQSTAYAVQALVAAGADPERVRRGGSRSPLAYLRSLTQSNGLVRYSRTSTQTSVWVTAQAAMALARRPLPLARVPPKRAAAAGATASPRATARTRSAAATSTGPVAPGLLHVARAAGVAFALATEPLT
jgi:energy-coupling factor transport system substrate-specific component